jgi:drug/metabolite transporter (DMT)-like permease
VLSLFVVVAGAVLLIQAAKGGNGSPLVVLGAGLMLVGGVVVLVATYLGSRAPSQHLDQ